MNDETIRELLDAYIDDDLSVAMRREVEAALLRSPELSWEAMTLQITRERLRADTGDVVASDAFRSRVLRKLVADNPHLTAESSRDAPEQLGLPIRLDSDYR